MSQKILIVDDQEVNRKLLRAQLGAEGFNTVEASDGQEALGLLKKQRVDAIISDILMPRMDGYRLCYEVRKDPKLKALPFIFYTATYTSPADEKLAAQAGGDKYLKKPASIRDIIQAVQDLTAGKEPRVGRRPVPVKELHIMKKYSEVLVKKLEEKNQELESATIELGRRNEEIQRNLERIRALHEIDLAITSTPDLRSRLDTLMEKIPIFFPYPVTAVIRLLNKESGKTVTYTDKDFDLEGWEEQDLHSLWGRTKVIVESKAPVLVRNLQTDPTTHDPNRYIKSSLFSYLGVPLLLKEEVLGTIDLYTREEHDFRGEEIEFLNTLASQAAIAINNAQLYEETAKQAVELRKAIKVKDEFLSVMSHELRTPLNVVVGYTGMIIDGMLGEINEKQKEALGKVITRANDELSIVNNILFATVLEGEKLSVESQVVVLGDFVNQLKSGYDLPLHKEVTLNWECSSPLTVIHTDGAKLKHMLQNLIHNAIKFTEKGSVTLSAKITEGSKQKAEGGKETAGRLPTADCLLPTGAGSWVEFRVSDTGVGIPKEHLPFIFDKFRQADSSETRSFGGVGMGLYIAKKFAELIGGTVEVESEAGKGSTFTVTIPCQT